MPAPVLSEADLARVSAAVAAAERRTSGEIVPFVVRRSGDYEVAVWRAASAAALAAMALALGAGWLYDGWRLTWLFTPWVVTVAAVLGGSLGALVASRSDALRRRLAGPALLAETVHRRAALAFVEEEVFATRDRTGILLFVSLDEHRFEVLGDTGIAARVEPEEWQEVVSEALGHIRAGRLADGLVAAVDRCGAYLERRGVPLAPDDTDELPDEVRLRAR